MTKVFCARAECKHISNSFICKCKQISLRETFNINGSRIECNKYEMDNKSKRFVEWLKANRSE